MKPATTLDQQLALLSSRGLAITDAAQCRQFLYDTSYYRLTGYARQFQVDPRTGDNTFEGRVSLEDLRRIVELDTELSLALIRCLGVVERVVRARFAYELAQTLGSRAFYLDRASYLTVMKDVDNFLDKLTSELVRDRNPSVARYAKGDDLSAVPVWVAFELLSFGAISRMLEYLADPEPRERVAASFSEPKGMFASTIHSLAVVRNRCAHHGQLWHRYLTIQTPVIKRERRDAPSFDPQGVFPAFLATRRLLRRIPGCSDAIIEVEKLITATHESFTAGLLHPRPQ